MLTRLLLVGLGGFAGAMLRHWVGEKTARLAQSSQFPVATFLVNVIGCLLIGLMLGWMAGRDGMERLRLVAVVGLLGSFTTFSTYGFESVRLLESGRTGAFLLNVGGQIGLGLLAVAAGVWIARGVGG